MNDLIKNKLAILPDQPGCYLMKNRFGDIIYVGKAKVLKNRVRSYFHGTHNTKTQLLVSEIADFEIIVTGSNVEALLLEINLIQKNMPKYNIDLKDDKSYPFIKITDEKFPRLMITRKVVKNSGKYFGPYPEVGAANDTKRMLDKLFPLRKCNKLPKKVCLYYHIGQCLAPCVNPVDPNTYKEMSAEIEKFLNGKYDSILKELEKQMNEAAAEMKFELAAKFRDNIRSIETIATKQRITNSENINRDVFGYYVDKSVLCIQAFFIRQGKIIERDVNFVDMYEDDAQDLFLTYLARFYENHFIPKEIIVPEKLENIEEIFTEKLPKIIVPQRGEKKALLDLATNNAKNAVSQKHQLVTRKENNTIIAVQNLGKALNIPDPIRIESFDNSNIQGSDAVSAMVVFDSGMPFKKEYRKFKIKTVEGANDYATMQEVIYRRYSRLIKENKALPDLILIDGGMPQVNAALSVLDDQLGIDIPIAGMVKNDKHKTSELLYNGSIVDLGKSTPEFFLLNRVQDEVHRFAIEFHRQTRSKSALQSELDEIEGVGPKRRKQLMKHFKSLKKIKEASVEELAASGIPERLAQEIYRHWR
ncbi:MAG: excinuclease ABC subunit UvrC [Lactobacillales bacterium]|jgi:excinuclease ABC subunit C|nr:excinuclease ABC subunit UvrC [Lactobacillales bacterium]